MPPISGMGAVAAGGEAIVLALPIVGGREGFDDAMLGGGAGLLIVMFPVACMVAPGRAERALEPGLFVELAMLLDKKCCTCCNCSAENESSCSSIFSKEGSRGSRWALSVCFSFPNGSMIV